MEIQVPASQIPTAKTAEDLARMDRPGPLSEARHGANPSPVVVKGSVRKEIKIKSTDATVPE